MNELIPASPAPGGEFLFYQTADGRTRLQVRVQDETVWQSLNQMADLFQRDKSVISRHISNVFEEGNCSAKQLLQILQQFKSKAASRCRGRSSSTTSMSSSPTAHRRHGGRGRPAAGAGHLRSGVRHRWFPARGA